MRKEKSSSYDPEWKEKMLWRLKTPNAQLKHVIIHLDKIERVLMTNDKYRRVGHRK